MKMLNLSRNVWLVFISSQKFAVNNQNSPVTSAVCRALSFLRSQDSSAPNRETDLSAAFLSPLRAPSVVSETDPLSEIFLFWGSRVKWRSTVTPVVTPVTGRTSPPRALRSWWSRLTGKFEGRRLVMAGVEHKRCPLKINNEKSIFFIKPRATLLLY